MDDRSRLASVIGDPHASSSRRRAARRGSPQVPAWNYAARSSQPQPRRDAPAQCAKELARDEPRDADADHADHDLLVGAADVRVPDEKAETAAARAADLAPPA